MTQNDLSILFIKVYIEEYCDNYLHWNLREESQ